MIDFPGQFKGLRGRHTRNALAKERDDLLVGMAVTVVDDHAGFEIVTGRRITVDDIDGEPVQADGDSIGSLPLEIAMTDKALRLVVP